MDEKKDKLRSLQTQVDTLETENDQLNQKMSKVKADYENVVKENMRMADENKTYNINLDAK